MSGRDHRLSPLLYVGCPMWGHRPWVGRWFPERTPAGGELAAYATWCSTVEGNTTHYATPSADTVARWAAATPATFRFCFKVPRAITHERRLRDIEDDLVDFLEVLTPLAGRLGPVQLQLPATFGPEDLPVLAEACHRLPPSVDWAVETRHRAFAAGGTYERTLNDLLAATGINRVILDARTLFSVPPSTAAEQAAWDRKPRLPVRPVATASQPLIRLIGTTDPRRTVAGWKHWIPKVAEWCEQGLTPHVFIHTPDNHDFPDLARRFHGLVAELVPGLDPLPEAAGPSRQLDLFG